MQFVSEIICAICHTTGPEVNCILCQSPHHIECWSYNNNRCSIYGCYSVHNSSQLSEFKELYHKAVNVKPRSSVFLDSFILCLILLAAVFGVSYVSKYESKQKEKIMEDYLLY